MSERITGQQARDLLDGTNPRPWKWYHDSGLISLQGADGAAIATDLNPEDSDLMQCAPALAETVAWLYGREPDEGEGPNESKTYYGHGIWYIEADPDQGVSLSYDLFRGLTPDEAIELARALLAAAEEARS